MQACQTEGHFSTLYQSILEVATVDKRLSLFKESLCKRLMNFFSTLTFVALSFQQLQNNNYSYFVRQTEANTSGCC